MIGSAQLFSLCQLLASTLLPIVAGVSRQPRAFHHPAHHPALFVPPRSRGVPSYLVLLVAVLLDALRSDDRPDTSKQRVYSKDNPPAIPVSYKYLDSRRVTLPPNPCGFTASAGQALRAQSVASGRRPFGGCVKEDLPCHRLASFHSAGIRATRGLMPSAIF